MSKKNNQKKKAPRFNDGRVDLHYSARDFGVFSFIDGLNNKLRLVRKIKSVRFLELIIIFSVITLSILYGNYAYLKERSFWSDTLLDFKIGGQNNVELKRSLNDIYYQYLDRKTTFQVDGSLYAIKSKDLGISFDTDKTIEEILQSESNDLLENISLSFNSLFTPRKFSPYVVVDKILLRNTIQKFIPELENSPEDAKIVLENDKFIILPAHSGVSTDYIDIAEKIEASAKKLEINLVQIPIIEVKPDLNEQYAKEVLSNSKNIYNAKISLLSDKPYFREEFALADQKNMIRFSKIFDPIIEKPRLIADLSPFALRDYLTNISAKISQDRIDTVLDYDENNKIIANGVLQDGYELDVKKTMEKIYDDIVLDKNGDDIYLTINTDKAKIIQPGGSPTSINELVAFGESDFKGSPENRKYNINNALNRFQNIVIYPNEVFSFNEKLGPVNEETGYKKELVIKEGGNLTIPEYGGGVCQVSTTLYRAALYAGLDIKERRSHSYKVVYYNPDGLDSTIYPSVVDLKFENNYEFPILIQNQVDMQENKVYFYIYGTKTDREITLDGPYRYAYEDKPETVTEYVPSMPTWWEQFKKGHIGFKTYWNRTVIMENGEEKKETIYSSYKAIPDKIQIGGPAPEEIPEEPSLL